MTVGIWVVRSEGLYAARITVKRSACIEICSDVCFVSLLLWHVGCRSCGESDLSIDCLERSVENILIGWGLGVGPGGTSVGVWTVETPTTCLEVI